MPDVQEVFRMATQKVRPDEGFVERQLDHQRRRTRNRRNGAIALAAILGLVAAMFAIRLTGEAERSQPADQPSPSPAEVVILEEASIVDLNTGETTPLPESIVGTADLASGYAVSPDGSTLAFVGPGDNSASQIFLANLHGTRVEQVTSDREATMPAWSPDGSKIAYIGRRGDDPFNAYVLDLATGVSTQVTFEMRRLGGVGASAPSFSPDGGSIVYTIYSPDDVWQVRIVPIAGGDSVRLVGGVRGRCCHAAYGALSPDGSLLSYSCSVGGNAWDLCLANADGTDTGVFVNGKDIPMGGTWSPDGTRIVYTANVDGPTDEIYVFDVSTGTSSKVAEGDRAEWLDDDTLIVGTE